METIDSMVEDIEALKKENQKLERELNVLGNKYLKLKELIEDLGWQSKEVFEQL